MGKLMTKAKMAQILDRMYSTSPNLSLSASAVEEWFVLFENEHPGVFEKAFRDAKLWSGNDFMPTPGKVMEQIKKGSPGANTAVLTNKLDDNVSGYRTTRTIEQVQVNAKGQPEVIKRQYLDITPEGQTAYDNLMASRGLKKIWGNNGDRRIFWYER